jgi:signal transduction histidine kinase
MKTDLIANVSHDIKTPLTSIISYTDLLSKEEQTEKGREYLEILRRQSNRLKKLTDDVVEASKASSGTIAMELAPCDLKILLEQTAGEYREKTEARGLSVILCLPEESTIISADGQKLWRIFENLMNNVCKYALSGTRVYLNLAEEDGIARITFRNVSEQPLNLSPEELTERFVRGDKSRNTEGSGLGLAIARSLTELQGGEFQITVDGDLFKVCLSFPTLKE